MSKIILLVSTVLLLGSLSCLSGSGKNGEYYEQPDSRPITHTAFTALLQKYVAASGKVNYRGLLKDSTALAHYLRTLSEQPPGKKWSREEQLAYWINAYNGFTLQLILRHYPVKSIKDIGSTIKIPFVNTPWDQKFIRIGNRYIDLNEIEHGILRKKFNEPRIHFAIVCASVSCPKLLNEAYTAEKLNQQLTQQAKAFINDPNRNRISADEAQLSKIFSWFKGDFTKNGSLIDFLNTYSQVKIKPTANLSSLDYNWDLNE